MFINNLSLRPHTQLTAQPYMDHKIFTAEREIMEGKHIASEMYYVTYTYNRWVI